MFENSLIYPIFAFVAGISFLVLVPKEQYKRFLLYGIIFGGLVDVIMTILLSRLNLIQYKDMGGFAIFGTFSFWTPITCTLMFAIFFYLLPVRKAFLVPYLIAFTGLNYAVGLVMQSLDLFEYTGVQKYLAPFAFFIWYSVSAWVYMKNGKITVT